MDRREYKVWLWLETINFQLSVWTDLQYNAHVPCSNCAIQKYYAENFNNSCKILNIQGIENSHLSDLSALVISSQYCDSVSITNFESH
jgi:hypothetical protein